MRPARLERATSWFVARRSIQLSYGRLRTTCARLPASPKHAQILTISHDSAAAEPLYAPLTMLTMTVRVSATIHRCLVETLGYLEARAYLIDPDMFRVDSRKVEALQRLFHAAHDQISEPELPLDVEITSDDLWTLDYYLLAAEEYSARSTEQGLLSLDDEDWKDVREWMARATALFRPH